MSQATLSLMQKVELLKQVAANPNIPSPPATVLRVLEKASGAECTIAEMCKIIQVDPGLCGKILRVVNSALFGLSKPATSITRALSVLGVNSSRMLVLAIALPEMHRNTKLSSGVTRRYWKASISGAVVAHEMALRFQSRDAEDAMAAALLRDIGELVLPQVFPAAAREAAGELERALHDTQCDIEEGGYGVHHAEVSAFILERWRLPTDMTEAVRWHHHPEQGKYSSPRAEELAFQLHFASRAAQLWVGVEDANLLRDLCGLARERFEMNETDVLDFLSPLGRKATEFAALLEVDMGTTGEFSAAFARASEELVHLSLSARLESEQAQEQSRRAETEAHHWRQQAGFDPLTKLPNRRLFDRKLEECYALAKEGTQFGLLFIDLDGFKPLNDRFGHAFGDLALQQVAETMLRTVRLGDLVARFGGDEFCILAARADEIGINALGNRLVANVREQVLRHGEHEGRLGLSIGAVCCGADAKWSSVADVLAGADRAMYLAKTRGGNRVVYLQSMQDTLPEIPSPAKLAEAIRESSGCRL